MCELAPFVPVSQGLKDPRGCPSIPHMLKKNAELEEPSLFVVSEPALKSSLKFPNCKVTSNKCPRERAIRVLHSSQVKK